MSKRLLTYLYTVVVTRHSESYKHDTDFNTDDYDQRTVTWNRFMIA